MSTSVKTIFIISLIGTFVFQGCGSKAFASELSSATQSLTTSTNQLIEAKDVPADNPLSGEEDLAYRKKVVSDALALSFEEIKALREKLESAKIEKESDLDQIRTIVIEWLDEQKKYFEEAEGKINDKDINLEAVKDLAKEIKAHRDENYNNSLTNALGFILSLETSRLTGTATDRWNKITSDLGKIEKAGLIKRDQFSAEMNEAKKMIDGARSLVEKALAVVHEIYLPAPQEELEDDVPTTTDEELSDEIISEEEAPSARELCEASIVNLKSAYGEFVKVSASLKKLLKLP